MIKNRSSNVTLWNCVVTLLLASVLAFPYWAGAAIIFEEDWESQAGMGEDPCNPPWESADNTNDHLKVLTDTGNLFGAAPATSTTFKTTLGRAAKAAMALKSSARTPTIW